MHNRRTALKLGTLGIGGLLVQNKSHATTTTPTKKGSMKIAYVLFDRITLLDFIGIYDPISRMKSKKFLPDLEWDLCSHKSEISDSFGLRIVMDKVYPDLNTYDMVIVPGGFGTRALRYDQAFVKWLQTAKQPQKVSICTGSLLLGAAGFLKGKRATTNFNEYETLAPYCQEVVKERIVEDGNLITAGAVASSLDLGLYICNKLVGKEKTELIRKSMDYVPQESVGRF